MVVTDPLILKKPSEIKKEEYAVYQGQKSNLFALAQINVTQDFLGLDESDMKCQNRLPIDECKTRKYTDSILEQCECLPFSFSLNHPDQVCIYTSVHTPTKKKLSTIQK